MESLYFPSQQPPIHSLPVELLSYIFTLSTHSSFIADDDLPEPSPSDFPFDPANMLTTIAISTVSRYWRDVALSTPALWTDICVSTELPGDGDEESRQLRNTMKPNAPNGYETVLKKGTMRSAFGDRSKLKPLASHAMKWAANCVFVGADTANAR